VGRSDQPLAGTCTKREYPISLLLRALRKHDYTLYSSYHNHCFSKHYQHQKRERRRKEEEEGGREEGEDRLVRGGGVEGEERRRRRDKRLKGGSS